jgi:hypothetical protein
LTVDEDRAQTRAIHAAQRSAQTLDGLLARAQRDAVLKVHRDAQRLLQPVLVVNPFATALTFADDRTRTRRDHLKYLTLIRTIALLHQHQRPTMTTTRGGQELAYIEATPADVALANRLAHEVLGRSLDELAPQTRRLLEVLDDYVTKRAAEQKLERSEVRFSSGSCGSPAPGATPSSRSTWPAWSSSSTWSCTAPSGPATPTSWPGTAPAVTAAPSWSACSTPPPSTPPPPTTPTGRARTASGRGPVGPRSGGGRGPVAPALSP